MEDGGWRVGGWVRKNGLYLSTGNFFPEKRITFRLPFMCADLATIKVMLTIITSFLVLHDILYIEYLYLIKKQRY